MAMILALFLATMIGANVGMTVRDIPSNDDSEVILNRMGGEIESLVAQASTELSALGLSIDLHILIDMIPELKASVQSQFDSDNAQGGLLNNDAYVSLRTSFDK